EMRDYMPPPHRAFLAAVEQGPSVRAYLTGAGAGRPSLRDAYNECVALAERFRAMHLQYAATYIFNQARKEPTNPSNVGTGGTPFMSYLKKHRDETSEHRLSPSLHP